jgi:hypothetical protein
LLRPFQTGLRALVAGVDLEHLLEISDGLPRILGQSRLPEQRLLVARVYAECLGKMASRFCPVALFGRRTAQIKNTWDVSCVHAPLLSAVFAILCTTGSSLIPAWTGRQNIDDIIA